MAAKVVLPVLALLEGPKMKKSRSVAATVSPTHPPILYPKCEMAACCPSNRYQL